MKTSVYKSNVFPIEITKEEIIPNERIRYELTVNGNIKVLTYDLEFIYLKAYEYEELYKHNRKLK